MSKNNVTEQTKAKKQQSKLKAASEQQYAAAFPSKEETAAKRLQQTNERSNRLANRHRLEGTGTRPSSSIDQKSFITSTVSAEPKESQQQGIFGAVFGYLSGKSKEQSDHSSEDDLGDTKQSLDVANVSHLFGEDVVDSDDDTDIAEQSVVQLVDQTVETKVEPPGGHQEDPVPLPVQPQQSQIDQQHHYEPLVVAGAGDEPPEDNSDDESNPSMANLAEMNADQLRAYI